MSRIRSIHPGLFTDEGFMSASQSARLLLIGLWCEAWDDGVFEWKPLTIKARLFPVDVVDVLALLTELEGLGFLCRFDAAGKSFGAMRNFRKWQKPKFPNSSKVLPPHLVAYVGIEEASIPIITEDLPKPYTNPAPEARLMEDGGGSKEKSLLSEPSSDDAVDLLGKPKVEKPKRSAYSADFEDRFWKPYPSKGNSGKFEAWEAWRKLTPEDRDAAVAGLPGYGAFIRGNPNYTPLHASTYISKRRFEVYQPQAAASPATTPDDTWLKFLRNHARYGSWPTGEMRKTLGPPPDDHDTRVPKHLLPEYRRMVAEFERTGAAA